MTVSWPPLTIALAAVFVIASGCRSRERTRGDASILEAPSSPAPPPLTAASPAPDAAASPSVAHAVPAVVIPAAGNTPSVPAHAEHVRPHGTSQLDEPMGRSWPAVNTWTDALEDEYSRFAAGIGRAVASHRCRDLSECLRDASANTLYDGVTDDELDLHVDCADLPYVLRAYFAFKRRLPFGFVSSTRGDLNRDPRYTLNVHPDGFMNWRQFLTPRALINEIGGYVNSGMYRTAPNIQNSDFYQVSISRRTVRPGSIFYDPNGHVLVVTEVRTDGQVFLMDGHPDGSLTYKRFGEAFVTGTARLGGGFKNFRPLRWRNGRIERFANAELRGFDGLAQFDHARYLVHGVASTYHAWVRASLSGSNAVIDPVAEFREQVGSICRDVSDRVDAVALTFSSGIATRPHPDALPENIYGTDGDWETGSSPSRDARLKASFRELFQFVTSRPDRAALAGAFEQAWREQAARPECQFQYTRSNGVVTSLTLDVVLDRIYRLGFDPYQCAELRWGAPSGSEELRSCVDTPDRLRWYADEQPLRNRIDREYGVPTPLSSGPSVQSDIDVRNVLRQLRTGASGG